MLIRVDGLILSVAHGDDGLWHKSELRFSCLAEGFSGILLIFGAQTGCRSSSFLSGYRKIQKQAQNDISSPMRRLLWRKQQRKVQLIAWTREQQVSCLGLTKDRVRK